MFFTINKAIHSHPLTVKFYLFPGVDRSTSTPDMKTLTLLVCTLLANTLGGATPAHILLLTLGPTQSHKVLMFPPLKQPSLKYRWHNLTVCKAITNV